MIGGYRTLYPPFMHQDKHPYWINYAIAIGVVILFFFSFITAHADSISFSPASPQVFDGTSDITVTCSASGNNWWTMFSVSGMVTNPGGGAWQTGSGCGGTVNAYLGGTFQAKATSSGIVHWVNWVNNGAPALAACFSAGATYSACVGSAGYLGQTVEYELCDTSCDTPEPTTGATTTPEILGAATGVAALGIFSFISGLGITVWIWTLFLG